MPAVKPNLNKPLVQTLLAQAAAAKVRYWDAMKAVEDAVLGVGVDPSDRGSDEEYRHVEMIAAGLDSPDDAMRVVDHDMVMQTIKNLTMERP